MSPFYPGSIGRGTGIFVSTPAQAGEGLAGQRQFSTQGNKKLCVARAERMIAMHLIANAETIDRLVEQGALLLQVFHAECVKNPTGCDTDFLRGEFTGWRSTIHTSTTNVPRKLLTASSSRQDCPSRRAKLQPLSLPPFEGRDFPELPRRSGGENDVRVGSGLQDVHRAIKSHEIGRARNSRACPADPKGGGITCGAAILKITMK